MVDLTPDELRLLLGALENTSYPAKLLIQWATIISKIRASIPVELEPATTITGTETPIADAKVEVK